MSASIYATPPPELNSEDTALSDVSNISTSTLNHNNNNNNNNSNKKSNGNKNNSKNFNNDNYNNKISLNQINVETRNNNNNNNHNHNNNNNHNNNKNNEINKPKTNHSKNENDSIKKSHTTNSVADATTTTSAATFIKNPTMPITTTTTSTKTLVTTVERTKAPSDFVNSYNDDATIKILIPKQEDICSSISLDNKIGSVSELENTKNDGNAERVEDSTCVSTINATTAAMAALAAAANAAMQLKWIESLNVDADAHKQQEQNQGLRFSEDSEEDDEYEDQHFLSHNNVEVEEEHQQQQDVHMNMDISKYMKKNLQKMLQLKETVQLLKQRTQRLPQPQPQPQQQNEDKEEFSNISKNEIKKNYEEDDDNPATFKLTRIKDILQQKEQAEQVAEGDQLAQVLNDHNPYNTYCKKCGENFENDIQLSLHYIQEHNNYNECATNKNKNTDENRNYEIENKTFNLISVMNVKAEENDFDELAVTSTSAIIENQTTLQHSTTTTTTTTTTNLKKDLESQQNSGLVQQLPHQQWPSVVPLSTMMPGFPFGPEAAAAAAAAGSSHAYLPFLGIPGFLGHSTLDNLSRPPLRIFNPEAYCDLCNKEFCNKYFLRKHKSNKHGIYDPLMTQLNASGTGICENEANENQFLKFPQQTFMDISMAAMTATVKGTCSQKSSGTKALKSETILPTVPVSCSPPITAAFPNSNIPLWQQHANKAQETQLPNQAMCEENKLKEIAEQTESLLLPAVDEQTPIISVANSNSQNSSIEALPEDYNFEDEAKLCYQSRQLSPNSIQQARESNFSQEKLKCLGVLNPEAFCEICGIEYCNKQILRSHKFKRHAIEESSENVKQQQQGNPKEWPLMSVAGMTNSYNFRLGGNKKSVFVQQMLAAATSWTENNVEPLATKRIKLEEPEDTSSNNTEQEESKSVSLETADSALQNLRKLQCMIQQLKGVETPRKQTITCHLCKTEVENLRAHIYNEHKGFAIDNFSMHEISDAEASNNLESNIGIGNELRCQQCEKDFSLLQDFKQHIREVHLTQANVLRDDLISPERVNNSANVVGVAAGSGARPPYTITPTSSYCEICNKELCNKYFMKTHMQRMHGIEIENGAQIGGVICNICNKELCSKYFLRVHKQNTHGILEEGVPLPQSRQNQTTSTLRSFEAQDLQQQQQQQPNQLHLRHQHQQQQQTMENDYICGRNMSPFKTEIGMENCAIDGSRLRNFKSVQNNLFNDHNSAEKMMQSNSKSSSPRIRVPECNIPPLTVQGETLTNNMYVADNSITYKCRLCPFNTTNYTLLYMHDLTHTLIQNRDSQMMNQINKPTAADIEMSYTSDIKTNGDNEPTNLSMRPSSRKLEDYSEIKKEPYTAFPLFPALQAIAKQHSKPVTFALPKTLTNSITKSEESATASPYQMQAFLLEAAANPSQGTDMMDFNQQQQQQKTEAAANSRFVPAIIYLPVKEHCSGSMTVCFKLTPF